VGWDGLWVQTFYLATSWAELGQSFGGLGWVEEIGPTDNSESHRRTLTYLLTYFLVKLVLDCIFRPSVDLGLAVDISPRGNESAPRVSL